MRELGSAPRPCDDPPNGGLTCSALGLNAGAGTCAACKSGACWRGTRNPKLESAGPGKPGLPLIADGTSAIDGTSDVPEGKEFCAAAEASDAAADLSRPDSAPFPFAPPSPFVVLLCAR